MEIIKSAIAHVALGKLNTELGECPLIEKYPVLDTNETNVKIWWDKLSQSSRFEVLDCAFHFRRISANYKCNIKDKFDKLSKSQQGHIKYVFEKKTDKYIPLDIRYM